MPMLLFLLIVLMTLSEAFQNIKFGILHQQCRKVSKIPTNPRHPPLFMNIDDDDAGSSSDTFDLQSLQRRIDAVNNPYHEVFAAKLAGSASTSSTRKPENVHVVLFNVGTSRQGIHSIDYHGTNIIFAFETKKSCSRFADSLRKQKFFDPSPCEFEFAELESMCRTLGGIFVEFVPEGIELVPPLEHAERFGHNNALQDGQNRLDYLFSMSEDDLEELGVLDTIRESKVSSWE